jgi:hypothetical protein
MDTAPAAGAAAVTPSDTTVVNCRALYVGTGGNVAVHMAGVVGISPRETSVVFSNVASGTILPISCYRVLSTSTTASNIVALY